MYSNMYTETKRREGKHVPLSKRPVDVTASAFVLQELGLDAILMQDDGTSGMKTCKRRPRTRPLSRSPTKEQNERPGTPKLVLEKGTDSREFSVGSTFLTEGSGEDGWSAILGYDVTCVDSRGVTKTYKGSPFYISDLDEETEHTCTVSAYNSKGYGPSSQFVATTELMPRGLPIWLLYEASK